LNKICEKPFVIFSSMTEDKGHLILDDVFWFSNLIDIFPDTRIITSNTSAKNLLQKHPGCKKNIHAFRDFAFLKKFNYRLHLLVRLISCERIKNSNIIFQGFDEFGILFYFLRIWNQKNVLFVVPTNNISPERLDKSKWILQFMLKIIIGKCDKFLYHTDYELNLIKLRICNESEFLSRCQKLKYHLIGAIGQKISLKKNGNDGVISFFGPTMSSKPHEDFCKLMHADNYANGKFEYRIINVSSEIESEIKLIFGNRNKIVFFNEYLEHQCYINLIATSTYVFLPHNHLYAGKLSGIFSDCISNGTPIISNNIEPVLEFFRNYGDMGFVFDFENDFNWEIDFLNKVDDIDYLGFLASIDKCKSDHYHGKIIHEFLNHY
jgi:hypothetical protein